MRTLKITLLMLLAVLGFNTVKADTVSPYLMDFNNKIATTQHDFLVGSNWGHIVGSGDYDGYGPYFMSYSYTSTGIGDSGALEAYRQYAGDNWGGDVIKDILVTPFVSGTVTLHIKPGNLASSSNPSFVEFYNVNDAGTSLGSLIKSFTVDAYEPSTEYEGWYTVSISLTAEQRIGIRAQYVLMDNFTATSANIQKERKLTISSVSSPTGKTPVYYNQNEDGSANINVMVKLTNSGDCDFSVGEEGYTLTFVKRAYYGSTETPYEGATFDIPVNIKQGDSAEFEATFNVPNMEAGWLYVKVRENISSTVSSDQVQAQVQEYASKFIFDKEGTTYYSSSNATTTPIDFGKQTEATTLNYEIYNPGSAPLTINSFTLPAPFISNAPTGQFTVASGEKKVIAMTLPATTPGVFSGNIEIEYTNFGKAKATYTLGVTGTIIDITKNWITFDNGKSGSELNGQFPAGSIHTNEVYISSETNNDITNYFLRSTSNVTKFITPRLKAAAGESFSYDAWHGSFSQDLSITVYSSKDRVNWTQVDKQNASTTSNPTGISSTAKAFVVTLEEAGDYFLAFELQGNVMLDNIYGLTLNPVQDHDWYILGSDIPEKSRQNSDYSSAISLKNISAEADNLTATLFVDGKAVAVKDVNLPGNSKTAAEGTGNNYYSNIDNPTIIELAFRPKVAGEYPTYIELKADDYTVTTDEVTLVVEEEKIVTDLTIGKPSGNENNSPLNLNYNNSETVSLYNAAKLASYGLKDGDKIQTITYKAYKTGEERTTLFSAYYEWTDDQSQTQPDDNFAFNTTGMTAIVEREQHTWPKTEGGDGVFEDYIVFTFAEPLVYQEGKSLRLVLRSENDSEANNYASVIFEKGETSGNHYYHRNDSREYIMVTIDGKEVNSKIGINASWLTGTNPVIYLGLYVVPVNVTGTVTNTEGQPIEGASVIVYNAENDVQYQGTTDADGKYAIDVIQDKLTYVATASAEGYVDSVSDTFDFTEGSVTQNFILEELRPETVTITLTADGTSYSGKWALDFSDLDIIPFKATKKNPNTVHVESVTIVPAKTGIIIKGEPGEYQVPTTVEESADDFSNNLLVANVSEIYTVTEADEGFIYRYVNKEGTAMFQKAKAGQIVSAGKAYLRLTEASALDFIGFDDDTMTGISQMTTNASSINGSPAYNLNGQRVSNSYRGIVIQNGKKFKR